MENKILKTVHEKLCEEFKVNFLPSKQFEQGLSAASQTLKETLQSLALTYQQLKNSGDKSLVKVSKEEYIVKQFNLGYSHSHLFNRGQKKYTIDNLEELKSNNHYDYKDYSDSYDKYFSEWDTDIVISLIEFIKSKTSEWKENNSDFSTKNLFWGFFHTSYLENKLRFSEEYTIENEEIINSPEKIIQRFREHYLSNEILKLYDRVEECLHDSNDTMIDKYYVNVGERKVEGDSRDRIKNTFTVFNKGQKIPFHYSSNYAYKVEGKFVNIFILKRDNLISISVNLQNHNTRIQYNIRRDFEKIIMVNGFRIDILKHYDPETIVFDTKEQAREFHDTIYKIKFPPKTHKSY